MKRLSILSLTLVLLLSLFSCEPKEEPVIKVSSIILNSEALSLTEGDTFKLTATVSPGNATDKTVVWSSSSASIASVEDGMVAAVKEGTATITATSRDGGAKASCTVTVASKVIAVQSITLDQTKVEMTVGESLAFIATVKPDNATDKTVTWKSSDANIASVDQSGIITAIGEGSATITAKAGDKEATCSVSVIIPVVPVESISLDYSSLPMEEGQTFTLTAKVKPDNATDKTVTWESSDTDVATVNNGVVTAVAVGTATITVKSVASEVKASCVITVSAKGIAVESITLNQTELTMYVGEFFTLTAVVMPDNATDKTIVWSSSNEDVITVDQTGKLSAINEGSATVSAAAGGKSVVCIVTVIKVNKYLTFSSEGTTTLSLDNWGNNTPILFYSLDKVSWTQWDYSEITFSRSSPIYLYGDNPKGFSLSEKKFSSFYASGDKFSVSGSIMSLINRNADLSYIPCDFCFYYLFAGCKLLLSAPDLPAETLSVGCYAKMFQSCTSLTATPQLPATNLAGRCYGDMFLGCTSLITASALPATEMESSCYENMFNECTSLQNAPNLPATTLADHCYAFMFGGCTNLTRAPYLPATNLCYDCYIGMFFGCSNLTYAPELPATELADGCYCEMFYGCTSLTSAPVLPAKILKDYCYLDMFNGCSKLSYVKCLARRVDAHFCTAWWLSDVAPTGTFVKNPDMTDWSIGDGGIPEGWTVVDAE